jgi:hypothetical protein
MAPYHVVLVHFPTALWIVAGLAILLRAATAGPLGQIADRALPALLGAGFVFGTATYVIGLMVWPWEALSSTPVGRNHMLTASWSLAYFGLLWVTRWVQGATLWDSGVRRLEMAAVAALGLVLVGITGTLGGHLIGVYTEVSAVLRAMGWEVYTTYYVPDTTLMILVAAALVMVVIGWFGRARA